MLMVAWIFIFCGGVDFCDDDIHEDNEDILYD